MYNIYSLFIEPETILDILLDEENVTQLDKFPFTWKLDEKGDIYLKIILNLVVTYDKKC